MSTYRLYHQQTFPLYNREKKKSRRVDLCFYFVETFSINSHNIGLGNKSFRVYGLYQAKYFNRLISFSQYHQYFFGLLGIPAHAVDNCHAATYIVIDMSSYLFVFIRQNQNLYRLTFAIDKHLSIDCIAIEDEYSNTPAQRAELDWLLI